MCQAMVRRLHNPSESYHVRKVARLLARPLASKESQKHIGGSKPSHLGDPLRLFLPVELVCCSA
jgi:hypothetical protein